MGGRRRQQQLAVGSLACYWGPRSEPVAALDGRHGRSATPAAALQPLPGHGVRRHDLLPRHDDGAAWAAAEQVVAADDGWGLASCHAWIAEPSSVRRRLCAAPLRTWRSWALKAANRENILPTAGVLSLPLMVMVLTVLHHLALQRLGSARAEPGRLHHRAGSTVASRNDYVDQAVDISDLALVSAAVAVYSTARWPISTAPCSPCRLNRAFRRRRCERGGERRAKAVPLTERLAANSGCTTCGPRR